MSREWLQQIDGWKQSTLVWDIETTPIKEGKPTIFRIFGAYSYKYNKYYITTNENLMVRLLTEHDIFVTYNGKDFDLPVLYENYPFLKDKLKYKFHVDLLEVLKPRALPGETRKGGKGRGAIIGECRLNGIIDNRFPNLKLGTVVNHIHKIFDEQKIGIQKEGGWIHDEKMKDFDYNIFESEQSIKDNWELCKKYLKKDVVITRELFEFLDAYFTGFKDHLSLIQQNKLQHINSSTGAFAYKSMCNDLGFKEEYGDGEKVGTFEGAFVEMPTKETWTPEDGAGYTEDFASQHPHHQWSAGLFTPASECKHKVNGVCPNPYNGDGEIFNLQGTYCGCEMGRKEKWLRSMYFLRLFYKRKYIQPDGAELKFKDCKVGDKIYAINHKTLDLEIKTLTDNDVNESHKYAKKGVDPREYSIKIIINCLTPDHNVLTKDGLKPIVSIRPGDMVYTIDNNKNGSYQPVLSNKRSVTTSVYNCINPEYNFCSTGNHKVLNNDMTYVKVKDIDKIKFPVHNTINIEQPIIKYKYLHTFCDYETIFIKINRNSKTFRNDLKELNIITSYEPNKGIYKVINNITDEQIMFLHTKGTVFLQGRNKTQIIKDKQNWNNFLKFIGYFISEGSLYSSVKKHYKNTYRGMSNKISISQYKDINPNIYDNIELCVKTLGLRYYKNNKVISFSNDVISSFIKQCYIDKKKVIPKFFFNSLNIYEKTIILNTMYEGDGNKGKQWRYTSNSKQLINQVAQICVEQGYLPKISSDTNVYRCHRKKSYNRYLKKQDITKIEKRQQVYDLTVANNPNFMIERNGIYSFVGNSSYGISSSPGFKHIYTPFTGADTTAMSRQSTAYMKKWMIKHGYSIAYGDSVAGDSFVYTKKHGRITIEEYYNRYLDTEYTNLLDNKQIVTPNDFALSVNKKGISQYKTCNYIMRHLTTKQMYRIYITNTEYIDVTKDHSIVIEKDNVLQIIKPFELHIGDELLWINDDFIHKRIQFSFRDKPSYGDLLKVRIKKITKLPIRKQYVYDLSVKDNNNYIANNILVHNTDSLYIFDPFNDEQRKINTVQAGIKNIRKVLPFVDNTYNMTTDAKFSHMFFFPDLPKTVSGMKRIVSGDDKLHFRKKNYVYITNDNKVKLMGLPVIKGDASLLGKKIFKDYLYDQILEDKTIKFDKDYLQQLIDIELDTNPLISAVVKKCNSYNSYVLKHKQTLARARLKKEKKLIADGLSGDELKKELDDWMSDRPTEPTGLQARLAKEYGEGKHLVIKNTKYGLESPGGFYVKVYNSDGSETEDALQLRAHPELIDIEKTWSELSPFIETNHLLYEFKQKEQQKIDDREQKKKEREAKKKADKEAAKVAKLLQKNQQTLKTSYS